MRKNKSIALVISALVLTFALVILSGARSARAEQIYDQNPETEYYAYVVDYEDLLSDTEEEELLDVMMNYTGYGHMFFFTTSSGVSDYEDFADQAYKSAFDENDNGVIFQIDMYNRQLTIRAYGELKDIITDGYSSTITDNCYDYATDGDYFSCAKKVFEQCGTLLEGGRIAQPMKYICNGILALVCGILINYFILRATSSSRAASNSKILDMLARKKQNVFNQRATFTHETRVRRERSSSSGGGGGSSGGGSSSGSHGF